MSLQPIPGAHVVVPEGAGQGSDPRKYVQLATVLRGRIQNGSLRPGDPVPSITALAAGQGGWARQTCAKALQVLEAEGLLIRVPGLGYFTAGPSPAGKDSDPQQSAVVRVADLLRTRLQD